MTDYDELRKSLEHGSRKERCDAAIALGAVSDEYCLAINDLAEALWRDESRAVRRAAAESLYRCGDVGFEMLMGMMIDNSIKIHLATRSGFGISRHPFGSDLSEMTHRDERTRKSIVEALGNFKDKHAVRAMIDVLEKEDAVGKEKTPEEWSSHYDLDWWYVSEHLGRIADADIDMLLDALENGCDVVRICVADALGAIENADGRVVSALIEVLKFDKRNDLLSMVAQNAAKSLGKLEDRRAVPALIESVGQGCVGVEAARALGKLGDKRAVPALIKVMPDEDAAYALGRLRDESAIPTLKEALNQEIKWMIEATEEGDYSHTPDWSSARVLCEFGGVGLDAIVDVVGPHAPNKKSFDKLVEIAKSRPCELKDVEQFHEMTIDAFGRETTPLLMYILRHINRFNCDGIWYFTDLIYLLNGRDFQIILNLLRDDNVEMRRAAAQVCHDHHLDLEKGLDVDPWDADGDVPGELIEALRDNDKMVRHLVAKMFRSLDGLDTDVWYTIRLLTYMIEDSNPDIRDSAARAFYNLGDNLLHHYGGLGVSAIIKSLLDASEDDVVATALADEMAYFLFTFWQDCEEAINPIVIEAMVKNKKAALLCNGGGSSVGGYPLTTPLKEFHREIWNTIMEAIYNKKWYATNALGSFVKWFSHLVCRDFDYSIIRELTGRLNDEGAEMIDRKIAAGVLGALYGGFVWQIDDIKRESNATLSALTRCASNSSTSQELRNYVVSVIADYTTPVKEPREPVYNDGDLWKLFREYHKSKESELNEQQ